MPSSISIEKLKIFNLVWDQDIKPSHLNFKSSVVSEIEKIIGNEVNLPDVSPETRAQVDNLASIFATRTKTVFSSPAVCIPYFDFFLF